MSKIDRATLAKVFPDPASIRAVEQLFSTNDSNSADVATALKNADDAQIKANAASLAASNAQASANDALSQFEALHMPIGAKSVGFASGGNLSSDNVQDALLELDAEKTSVAGLALPGGAQTVGVTASKNLSGTNVQLALQELDQIDGSGFRNVVINGSFIVNQRKYVSGTATTSGNQYTFDLWRVVISGQSVTFASTNNGNLVTVPAGGYEQVIEGALIVQTNYVIGWLGTASGFVNGVQVNKGDVLSLTPGSNCTIRFASGSLGSVQMEQGKTAHNFEPRPYSVELRLCQRYLYAWTSLGTMGICGSGGGGYAFPFPVQMRIVPSYLGLTNATFSDGVNVITITSTSLFAADLSGASVSFSCGASTAGRAAILNSGGTAIFSAEF